MSSILKSLVIPTSLSDEALYPLTEILPKELLPFGDVPLIHNLVDEGLCFGVEDVLFIVSPDKKSVSDHFNVLKKRLEKEKDSKYLPINFSSISQKKKTGSAYSILKVEKKIEEESFAVSFPNYILQSKTPASAQLFNVFRTSKKPVVCLSFDKDIPSPFAAKTEKIANRLYKIKKIVERTDDELPGVFGRYILTPTVFDYLKSCNEKDDLLLAINHMLSDGKTIYGYEPDGKWYYTGDRYSYLKSQVDFLTNE